VLLLVASVTLVSDKIASTDAEGIGNPFKGSSDSILITESLYFPQVHDTTIYVPYNNNFSKETEKFNKAVKAINKKGIDNWYEKYYGK